jgi:ABC-type xylose transport system permease subunit
MKPLLLIRFAMLFGVLLFGGVTWYLRRDGSVSPFDPSGAKTLLWVARAVWGLSMAACVILFIVIRNARSRAQAQTLSLVGWASGEAVALMGGVVWFLTGNTQWYQFGLVYLVLTFLAFPAA